MGWTIQVEPRHLALWGRFARFWASYVAFCVVVGWHLGPTLEEVLMLTGLPLLVLIPYTLGCLGLAALRVLLRPLMVRRPASSRRYPAAPLRRAV